MTKPLRNQLLVLCVWVGCVLCSGISYAGQADAKHAAKKHIGQTGKQVHQLSLDDVLPGSNPVLLSAAAGSDNTDKEPVIVRVTGYSAFNSEIDKSESGRLRALRASTLDAYRAMSERIYGVSISGQSSVNGFELKEDHFSVKHDAFVRGAKVVSIHEKKGQGFETVLELILPGNFDDCVNKVGQFKHGLNCLRPLPNSSMYMEEGMTNTHTPKRQDRQGSGYFLN